MTINGLFLVQEEGGSQREQEPLLRRCPGYILCRRAYTLKPEEEAAAGFIEPNLGLTVFE